MNQRFTQANMGRNAVQNDKEVRLARRQGGPYQINVPPGNNITERERQGTFERRMNGFGRAQVPAEMNAIDRDIEKRIERKNAALQRKAQGEQG